MITQTFPRLSFRPLAALVVGGLLIAAPLIVTAVIPLPTLSVPIKDVIKGDTENISFTGKASITGKVIDDPDFRGPPVLQLLIDFSGVTGVGVSSGKQYVTTAQAVLHRPLITFDPIQATFPYYASGNFASARTALASFAVSYGPPTGLKITSKVTTPSF